MDRMDRSPDVLLTEEFSRFEDEMRAAALAIVHEVFTEELARRGYDEDEDEDDEDDAEQDEVAAAPAPVAAAPAAKKKRGWTRDEVIDELATWLLSGTTVEASFVKRYGRPGLAAAAKRLFGRFDAALNAANVALAQKYPDGPPSAKKSMS